MTYLNFLFRTFFVLLLSPLDVLVVIPCLHEGCQEFVKDAEELIRLDQGTILTEQTDSTIESGDKD